MNIKNETYFGDKDTFAIRYIPKFIRGQVSNFAYCHLVLNGQIIGNKDELCYLNSWKNSIEKLKNRIKNDFNSFKVIEFSDKSDNEMFELIWKANPIEEEFNHLPFLDNKVWVNCHISIDETTDAYLITLTEDKGKIKFLWKGIREPCPPEKIYKLFVLIVDKNSVLETLEKCLKRIDNK